MTQRTISNKKCALCHQTRPIEQFLTIVLSSGQTQHGTVCYACLGRDTHKSRRRKLNFEQAPLFLMPEDDDDSSGGWDAEDRAQAIKQILTIDAKARGLFFDKKKQSAKKDQQANQQKKEKQEQDKKQLLATHDNTPMDRDSSSPQPTAFPKPAGVSHPTTQETKKPLFQSQQHRISFSLSQHATPKYSGNPHTIASKANTLPTNATNKATTAQPNHHHDTQTTEISNRYFTERHQHNEHLANSHQQLGQTLTFLSPFGLSGTRIRNQATRGLSASYMDKMFGNHDKIAAKEAAKKHNERIEQDIEQTQLQETLEKLKQTFKK